MKRLRMLIVEDEFLSRNLLASLVAERGSADVAVDGEEAVRAVKYAYDSGTPYDVIFLDIMLPVMDGQEALRRIRDYERERGLHAPDGCKVVMTTALSDARNVMDAFKASVRGLHRQALQQTQDRGAARGHRPPRPAVGDGSRGQTAKGRALRCDAGEGPRRREKPRLFRETRRAGCECQCSPPPLRGPGIKGLAYGVCRVRAFLLTRRGGS